MSSSQALTDMAKLKSGSVLRRHSRDYRLTHRINFRLSCQRLDGDDKLSSERIETWYCERATKPDSKFITRIFTQLKKRPKYCPWGVVRSWYEEQRMLSKVQKGKGKCILKLKGIWTGTVEDGRYRISMLYYARPGSIPLRAALLSTDDEYEAIRRGLCSSLLGLFKSQLRIFDDYENFLWSTPDKICVFADFAYAYRLGPERHESRRHRSS